MIQPSGDFDLQVYPNPANSEVQISLSIPEKQKVNLSAYTIDGKLVTTLQDGMIDQGTHHYLFGKGLLPGTYLLRVNSASAKSDRKIILLN